MSLIAEFIVTTYTESHPMNFFLFIVLLLVLISCDNTTSPQENSKATTENVPDYLNNPLQGKVSQRGLYRMVRSSGVVNDSNTNTGKVISKPVIQQVESTELIPLVKGAQMYLQYRLWPLPNQPAYVNLRRVLKHPEMKLPDGSVSTGSDFEVKRRVSSNHVIVYTGYGFDEDYELVEGDWVFEIWYQDKKLIEQKFTTYWPDEKEIAKLKPVLSLGNNVQSKMQLPENPEPQKNWPRVMVGENVEAPAGVHDALSDPTSAKLGPAPVNN